MDKKAIEIAAEFAKAGDSSYTQALFALLYDDLRSAGVDDIRLGASMLRAFTCLEFERIGRVGVVQALRDIADKLDQDTPAATLKPCGLH